jgi:hypothetical protein
MPRLDSNIQIQYCGNMNLCAFPKNSPRNFRTTSTNVLDIAKFSLTPSARIQAPKICNEKLSKIAQNLRISLGLSKERSGRLEKSTVERKRFLIRNFFYTKVQLDF